MALLVLIDNIVFLDDGHRFYANRLAITGEPFKKMKNDNIISFRKIDGDITIPCHTPGMGWGYSLWRVYGMCVLYRWVLASLKYVEMGTYLHTNL